MTGAPIEWSAIRPLNGSQADGFEELCAQLARAEAPTSAHFTRKGTPDAGLECFAAFPDGSEWGWQAKFFSAFGDSQWSQLDESVRTALDKHPALVRMYLCLPLDRSDSRIPGHRTALQRWDERVQKWSAWATAMNRSVAFEFWGSSELLERLVQPQHAGRVRFWFHTPALDATWFAHRLEEATDAAGPRYTPEAHVELPIAQDFEALGRTQLMLERLKRQAREIRGARRALPQAVGVFTDPDGNDLGTMVHRKVDVVLTSVSELEISAADRVPLPEIIAAMDDALQTTRALGELIYEGTADPGSRAPGADGPNNAGVDWRSARYAVNKLENVLRQARDVYEEANRFVNSSLVLLTGDAGTGKTHLLCDVAVRRLRQSRPTILLMGQRFLSTDDPWRQALAQLDLAQFNAHEFVGALEAAAQAADTRALVLVDAVNEGAGRMLWPPHLAPFLSHLRRSPWIAVVVSVRSSYRAVVPEEVRAAAVPVAHHGFEHFEYDAVRTFFHYYGLELPSTPLLTPEFRNPLFLKTLCLGLTHKDITRLPRGFHGISLVFASYFDAADHRLANSLGYNENHRLVVKALHALADALNVRKADWLPLEAGETLVNALLPGRDFERSLYHAMVVEGILVEELAFQGKEEQQVVMFGYERFADHLRAKAMLRGITGADPAPAFAAGGRVAEYWPSVENLSAGLLEALCVVVPEDTGRELYTLAPELTRHRASGHSFRQSIVWRSPSACTTDTLNVLNECDARDRERNSSLEALLTVATLPEHPFNSAYLDGQLRKNAMPERDTWWSTYLHHTHEQRGAAERLIDWASTVPAPSGVSSEVCDLAATALAWMFSTPNRFVRDRATTALVQLLCSSPDSTKRLLSEFASVDDPYVKERVFAVAYGVAMRLQDRDQVDALAQLVYSLVFATDEVKAHILLRDYARGVIERAVALGGARELDVARARPPYKSTFPTIPSDDDIAPLRPDYTRGSHDSGEREWSRNRIGSSVLSDDFARYVIGTNSPMSRFLTVRLDESPWLSPEQELDTALEALTATEFEAWEAFQKAEEEWQALTMPPLQVRFVTDDGEENDAGEDDEIVTEDTTEVVAETPQPLSEAQHHALDARTRAVEHLEAVAERERAAALANAVQKGALDYRRYGNPPRMDLALVQCYVLWRAFDLGWTTERFGDFDRFTIGYHGREAHKAERFGKKYQWIAYHEILAYLADHYQYHGSFSSDNDQRYEGPWQESYRDIDPSTTLRSLVGGTGWGSSASAWWSPDPQIDWGASLTPPAWAHRTDDLPMFERYLMVVRPGDSSEWCNLSASCSWRQELPEDQEPMDVPRREFWFMATAYLVRRSDRDAFMTWAASVDFYGRWMPSEREVHHLFLGEFGWSPASAYFDLSSRTPRWIPPKKDCPVEVRVATTEYQREATGFDCSVDEGFRLYLPPADFASTLHLAWQGPAADFIDANQRVVAFDPSASERGPSAMLIELETLQAYLNANELAICWSVLGEKTAFGPGLTPGHAGTLRFTGAYTLERDVIRGFLNTTPLGQDG